jgi:murein DD-endopeptidase MepM/ murein hydrolase activator NlpD
MNTRRLLLISLMLVLVAGCSASEQTNAPADNENDITMTVLSETPAQPTRFAADVEAEPDASDDSAANVFFSVEADPPPQQGFLPSHALQATWTPSGPTVTPFPTSTPFTDPELTLTPAPDATAVLSEDIRGDHFWLGRPFATTDGIIATVNAYHYGTTAFGYQPHHGVDIENPIGTNVRAVASGRVFYAGDDLNAVLFGPQPNFYGNLVVIEHEFELPENGKLFKFYTLYGHLSQFFVRPGDVVEQFDEIGAVGQEGVALGPHLHLEMRIGDPYDYSTTYNPNLWIQPFPGYGVLAGRVLLRNGGYVPDVEVELRQNGRTVRTTLTYHYEQVNQDPYFLENFVMPDVRQGDYEVVVKYAGREFSQPITINAGRTTIVNQIVD